MDSVISTALSSRLQSYSQLPSGQTDKTHHYYLSRALALAQERCGFCAPNPPVGAVLVRNKQILSQGTHWMAGCPHAEVVALNHVPTELLKESTLYVTLEPCCHQGKTPPCTHYIIDRQIKKVVYAQKDPNPRVSGRGHRQLLAAGIECEQVELPDITTFYKPYCHWTATQKPWVTVKLAITLDGRIAYPKGQPASITGSASKRLTHLGRCHSDAILTTSRTVCLDNPCLNVRLTGKSAIPKPIYVLDSQLATPPDANIFSTSQSVTLFHTMEAQKRCRQYKEAHGSKVRCVVVKTESACLNYQQDKGQTTYLALDEVLSCIGRDGVHNLWVEAGGQLFTELMQKTYINKILIYVAPKTLGYKAPSAFYNAYDFLQQAQQVSWQLVGNDVVCEIAL